MKKETPVFILVFLLMFSLTWSEKSNIEKEKSAIKKVILSAYRDGICNVGDIEAIKNGFHPGFNLLGMGKDDLWKLPIYSWIKSVEKKKKEGKFPAKVKVGFKFLLIDVVGTAAVVKIGFYKGKKLTYTDYLSLYKFPDGWKIVNKIFFKHPLPPPAK